MAIRCEIETGRRRRKAMTTQHELDNLREAWSMVVSKRAEAAAVDGDAYRLLDRAAEHLDDEIFDLRMRSNVVEHLQAIGSQAREKGDTRR
jgi:hypothetical protein